MGSAPSPWKVSENTGTYSGPLLLSFIHLVVEEVFVTHLHFTQITLFLNDDFFQTLYCNSLI